MNEIAFRPEVAPAVITADFDAMRGRLERQLRIFEGLTPEQCADLDPKVCKAARSELSDMRKELDEARKAVKREYNRPLAEFEAKVKELVALIDGPRDMLDKAVKERERIEREERREALKGVYEEFAPLLAAMVPFDRVLRGEWLNKTGFAKRPDEVREEARRIANELDAVKRMGLHFPEQAERDYVQTLDLGEVMRRDGERFKEAERIKAARAAQTAYKPASKPEREGTRPAAKKAVIRTYAFEVDMTEEQRDELVAWLKERGIRGTFKVRRVA